MSKRTDKKKQKKIQVSVQTTEAPVKETPAKDIDIFIQYQNHEYLEKDIIEKIKAKCEAEGNKVTGDAKLCIYIKPEDKKAYYTYADTNGYVEL